MPTRPPSLSRLYLGCAGWSLPREHWPAFAVDGTHLQRYSSRFPAVEINSSFYRPHRPATYAKWAASVARDFRFSVKVPKQITHERRLIDCGGLVDEFLGQCSQLGEQLGCLLIQLPPSLAFDAAVAGGSSRPCGTVIRVTQCLSRDTRAGSCPRSQRCCKTNASAVSPPIRPLARRRSTRRLARHSLLPLARLTTNLLLSLRRRPAGAPRPNVESRPRHADMVHLRQHRQWRRDAGCVAADGFAARLK